MAKAIGDVGFPSVVHPRDHDTAWVFPMDGTSWLRLAGGMPAARARWTVSRQAKSADAGSPSGSNSGRRAASSGRAATRAIGGPASRSTCPRSTRSRAPRREGPLPHSARSRRLAADRPGTERRVSEPPSVDLATAPGIARIARRPPSAPSRDARTRQPGPAPEDLGTSVTPRANTASSSGLPDGFAVGGERP